MALSGLKKCDEPSRCERNGTPSSVTLRRSLRLKTWKPPGVGEDGAVPRHEFLHAAQLAHHLDAGPQVKMVGVVQQDLDAELFQHVLRDTFDRADRAHRHEDRRPHLAVGGEESPGARFALASFNLKAKRHRKRL